MPPITLSRKMAGLVTAPAYDGARARWTSLLWGLQQSNALGEPIELLLLTH